MIWFYSASALNTKAELFLLSARNAARARASRGPLIICLFSDIV